MFKYRLKNYFFLSAVLLLLSNFSLAQRGKPANAINSTNNKAGAFIDVNVASYPPSAYTPEQLVKNILINGGSTCSIPNVSNVTISPTTNQAATNADRFWGYFHKGTTNFPFTDGIVLVTGMARKAGNSASSVSDIVTGSTVNDPDLVAAVPPTPPVYPYNDNVILEFDFVPNSNQVKFNYIFASEEYSGTYPCQYSDAFALLIRPVSGGPYVNLAVLPNGAGPVAMTNIHPLIPTPGSGGCVAVNEMYFGGYNTAVNTVTNFDGRTVPLTAIGAVTPGVAYHFKMVLSDYRDTGFDSAVFLEGGSFDLGIKIVDANGVPIPASINVCDNTPTLLTAQANSIPGSTYQWYLNGVAIPGATGITYTATQPGVYTVQIAVPGNNCPASASVTIVGGTSPTVTNATLTACNITGNATFNLTQAQPFITSAAGATFKYYLLPADATAGNGNFIPTPTAFQSLGAQTIYVNVATGFCSKVAELQLVKADPITVNIATPVPITCLTGNTTLNGSSSVYPTDATFNWTATNGGTIVSGGTTLTPVVSSGGTYTLTITKVWSPGATCTGTASIIVLEDKTPPVLTLTANKTTICQGESITLTATGANSYVWNNNLSGTGPTQIVTPTASTTYVINGTTLNGCAASNPAALAITVVPAITSTLQGGFICIGDQLTLDAGAGPNYTYLWNTGATSRTISVAAPGTYTVKISNGVCTKEFTAVVSLAVIPQINKVDYSFGTLTVSVNNPSNGVLEYSADNGVTWQNSNVFNNVARNIIVKLRVRVKNTSCVGYLEYFTFTMTNVITPNGDNVNDMIDFRGIVNYKDFKATIADRYGKKVYEASKLTPYWDGYFQGKKLPTSSYWYQVTFEDPASKQPQVKTGWILLKNFE
jgi:gliding motility-associated-like protein